MSVTVLVGSFDVLEVKWHRRLLHARETSGVASVARTRVHILLSEIYLFSRTVHWLLERTDS